MLRVLVVTEAFLPRTNGVVRSVCSVLDHLELRGWPAALVAPSGPETYAGAVVTAAPYDVDAARTVIEAVVRDFGPDVVHLAAPQIVGRAGIDVARAHRIPTVAVYQADRIGWASQHGLESGPARVATEVAELHGAADLTLVPSSASERQVRALGVERVRRWGRGVDLDLFDPRLRDPDLRAAWARPDQAVVGYVGRLSPEKEIDLLRVVERDDALALVVVGAGPDEQRLRHELPRACFVGELDGRALAAAYASFDVFVHPGRHETFCQAVQEALASGVPVVATASGGPLDLVRHGATGLLFEPGDTVDLLRCVRQVAADRTDRAVRAATIRSSVTDRTWARVCDELLGHYRSVVPDTP